MSVVEAVTPASVQVIVAVPVASAEAIPWVLTLTIFMSDEDQQVEGGVAILPSLSVAEAVSCSMPPTVRKINCGTTASEETCGGGGVLAAPQAARSHKLERKSKNNRDFFMTSPQICIATHGHNSSCDGIDSWSVGSRRLGGRDC